MFLIENIIIQVLFKIFNRELTSDEVSLTVSDRETVDALYNLDFQLTTEFFDQWPNPPQVDDPEYQQFDKLFCQKGSFREEKVVPEISHSPQVRTFLLVQIKPNQMSWSHFGVNHNSW